MVGPPTNPAPKQTTRLGSIFLNLLWVLELIDSKFKNMAEKPPRHTDNFIKYMQNT
jgi:hypothetical protein